MIGNLEKNFVRLTVVAVTSVFVLGALFARESDTKGKLHLEIELDDDAGIDTVSRLVTLKNIKASEIEPFIKSRLSRYGIVQVNDNLNMIIITDKKPKVDDLVNLVKKLDVRGVQGFLRLETELIPLKFILASKIKPLVEVRLSSEGEILVDSDHNALLVKDVRSKINIIKDLIDELDSPVPQVHLESKIVEVKGDYLRKAGIDWAAPKESISSGMLGGVKGSDLTFGAWAVLDFRRALDFFSLLVNQANAKVVSSPKIVALNNIKGSVKWTDYIQKGDKKIVRTGLELDITPCIKKSGEIMMEITLKIDSLIGYSPEGYPLTSSSGVNSTVSLKNGRTLVMGGMESSTIIKEDKGVPVLKEIPVIGILFRKKTTTTIKSQLLIFITPRIMEEMYEE